MKKAIVFALALFIISSTPVFATETTSPASTNPSDYHASWNSQSTYPVLSPLEITTVWIKFKNDGPGTWYNYGEHPVRLGTSHEKDRESAFYKHTWLSTNRPANLKESQVKPGGIGTFEFYIKAPETAGEYKEYFQPVVDGITWLEDRGVFLKITVSGTTPPKDTPPTSNIGHNSASWVSQSEYLTLKPGDIKTVWVKFKNTGDTTWYNYGTNPTRLGTSNPIDRVSSFAKETWLSTNRPANLKESQVKPGETGTFEFYIKAPATEGEYKEYFRPVIEGITWLDDVGLFWIFNVNKSTTPVTPTGSFTLTGKVENGKAVLDWTDYVQTLTSTSSGISGYKVVRSETKTNPTYPEDWWVYLSGTTITAYTDSTVYPGHSYYYRIGAYKSDSGVVQYTNNIQLTIPENTGSTATFTVTAVSQSNGVKLTWNKYTPATLTSSTDIEGYKLLRSTTNSNPIYPDNNLLYISGATTTTYIDTSAVNGQKYYYRLAAYKGGSIIAYSNTVTITASTSKTETGESISLNAANQSDGLKLFWNEYTANEIDGYKVMRSTSVSVPTYPNEYYKYIAGSTNTVFTDSTTTQNQGYYYRIGAYKDGSILTYSNTIYIIADHDVTANDIYLEAGNVNGGISLTWTEYEDDTISGYKLLRSTTNSNPTYNGTYYKYLPSASSVGYVDTDTTSGQKYYYRIGAYRNGEVISYSNTVTITAD